MTSSLEFIPVVGMPEVGPGTDLPYAIHGCLEAAGTPLRAGDVVIVASKVVAKNEGRVVDMADVDPGRMARALARVVHRDARELQVMLRQGGHFMGAVPAATLYRTTGAAYFGRTGEDVMRAIQRMPTFLFFEKNGRLFTEAGIDASNVPGEAAISLLPFDSHNSARRLAAGFERASGERVAVIVSDSELRIMGRGSLDIGLGWWGIQEIRTEFGREDRHGLSKFGGVDHIVDALCGAAGVIMGQTDESIPAVVVRGLAPKHMCLDMPAGNEDRQAVTTQGWATSHLVFWGVVQLFWSRLRWYLALLNPFI